jgi:hypothetical protein
LFIGHTRFSLFDPNSGGWRASNGSRFKTVEEYQEYLFSEDRLDPRCDIFVNHSLPQVALAAEGYDVTHVVSYSSALPANYQAILEEAAAKYPFLVLDRQVDGQPSVTPMNVARKAHRGPEATRPVGSPFGMYRLDDDDLLPADYFAQVSAYLTPEHAGMMVSLGAGATALYIDGAYYNVRECYAPMIAIGLMSICRFDADGTLVQPIGVAHNRSDRKNPVIMDSRGTGFLWTRHVAQDTSLGWGLPEDGRMADIIRKYMDRYPEAPDGAYAEAFPAIADKMRYQPGPDYGTLHAWGPARNLDDFPTFFTFCAPMTGRVDVSLDVTCSPGTETNNAMILFELVDEAGTPIEPSPERIELPNTGLSLSQNSAIGYYAYIDTAEGSKRVRHAITLPPGIGLRSISTRRYRQPTAVISVSNVKVQEVNPKPKFYGVVYKP